MERKRKETVKKEIKIEKGKKERTNERKE